ncbi:hypothetical protein ACQCX2_14825 [Propionibacteriaceae bacterium Y1700]|uniref:hypothetical protein n=1 Tax=Microlunatus sp. Y1700 TaxID=3418487 RepID=UPI003DA738E5
MQNFVREAGLLAVASLAFPNLTEVDPQTHVIRQFSVWKSFASADERSEQSDALVAEFVALCWRYWAPRALPEYPVVVKVSNDPGPSVTMLRSSDGQAADSLTSRLPPIYRWEMPDLGEVIFDASLAPEFRAWRDNLDPPGTVAAYLDKVVTVSGVAAVAQSAFPELIEVDDHILIKDQYNEKTFNDWLPSLKGDRGAAERTVNHFVVWDHLYGSEHDDEADEQAAEFIALCWRYWFHDQYPDRRFQVSIIDQYGPTVTVYELRD